MIAWLNAAALWGLGATLGAVVVHLLFRRRARRLLFPTLRFVNPTFTSALRARWPTDAGLLAVRIAILAAAALALAQPLLVTPARARAWSERVARAVVVDTSDSMRSASDAVSNAVRAEASNAVAWTRIENADLGAGLREAASWLGKAPPAKREIVVVSDLQSGALRESDLAQVPDGIGVRFVRVGSLPSEREASGLTLLNWPTVATSRVRVANDATSVDVTRSATAAAGLEIIAAPGSDDAVGRLGRVVSAAGTPAPSGREPVVLSLRGSRGPGTVRPISRGWMVRAVQRLQADEELQGLGEVPERSGADPWVTVLQDQSGEPLVRAAAAGERLVVEVAAPPTQFLAAAALRATLMARANGRSLRDAEVLAIAPDAIARWTRDAAPVSTTDARLWQHAQSDARWLWAVALTLLAIEALIRRQRVSKGEALPHAA